MFGNPFDFSGNTPSDALYEQWEKNMSAWWEGMMRNPLFLGSMGRSMAMMSQVRHAWEKRVDDNLERARLPTRRDMVRMTSVLSLLEDKLLRVEDELLATRDKLVEMEKAALKARIDAAENQLALEQELVELRRMLADALAARDAA